MKRLLIGSAVAVLFIIGLWAVAVPEEVLLSRIEQSLTRAGLSVEIHGFKKGLLYDFAARDIIIRRSDAALLTLNSLSGKINPLALFLLRLPLSFSADVAGGKMSGAIDLLRAKSRGELRVDDARMEDIPFFAAIGIKGRGKVYGDYKNENGIGKLKLSVSGAQFENDSFWGFPFPLTAFSGVRGAMDISGSRVRIIALSLEGKGIYARLKGDIKGNKADLMAEVMRDPAFVDTTGILPLLENYRISPGYYVVPLKSSLPF